MPQEQECHVLFGQDVDDRRTLDLVRQLAGKAKSAEEFEALLRSSFARNEIYKVLTREEVDRLGNPSSRHLFRIGG